ncbi:heparinase II/III-family protein [Puniceicoccaceae bacterium K14]|nr:heparinase II/III-family protein [Puniceicoccaceae bacterium K14]
MKIFIRKWFATVVGVTSITAMVEARPQILVTSDQHEEIVAKVTTVDWAESAYEDLKAYVDKYIAKTEKDPDWVTSRMAMNWDTHYKRPMTLGSRTIGGEGRAPVPTPRFAGARDWKTDYERQKLDDLIPFNDQDGDIMFINIETGESEWVSPAITGHLIERINNDIMKLAADAAFLYWVSGDVKYAEFATPIMWSYMEGFSHVETPHIADKEDGPHQIIGVTSYEVIHEGILHSIATAYDFLHPYLATRDEVSTDLIEIGIKRFVDRIIAGGGRGGNWNLHQATKIAYGGLALQSNDAYEDGRGREYYIDIALNADLPHQLGLMHVIRQGYDQKTAVWPEAAGYAFDVTANIIEIASLMSSDVNGRKVLEDSIPSRALLGQLKQTYPTGVSHAMGDTSYTRIDTRAAELLLSWAVKEDDTELAETLSAVIQAEQDAGAYSRKRQKSLIALTRYVSELPEASEDGLKFTPTYFAEPINLVMLRNMPESGDVDYALSATVFGTKGGHMHANGLAVELYGAGHVLGIDSGRGTSYWQADHNEYYKAAPAHNTVIVNGVSNYASAKRWGVPIAMEVENVEPAFDEESNNPNLTYITSSFAYPKPEASQQRTLALVRIDETTSFYFDVFRSKRNKKDQNEYHDWFYHGMADEVEINDLELKPSSLLTSAAGNQKGYDYFTDEVSTKVESTIHAKFPLHIESDKVAMDVWVLGGEDRQLFKVSAPANRGARHNFDEKYWNRPTPTIVIRQTGEAWDRPFVAVYEPSIKKDGAKVKSVEELGNNEWLVAGKKWRATLKLEGVELSLEIDSK